MLIETGVLFQSLSTFDHSTLIRAHALAQGHLLEHGRVTQSLITNIYTGSKGKCYQLQLNSAYKLHCNWLSGCV